MQDSDRLPSIEWGSVPRPYRLKPPRPLESAARTSVLLTGFGPFPGVPVNATMQLVPQLAAAAQALYPGCAMTAAILPTEWHAAPARVDALIKEAMPDLIIHFGVSRRARGFEIERRGVNVRANAPDARGRAPQSRSIRSDGRLVEPVTLPCATIVHRLRLRGIPAYQSWSAGTYLCNATLYHAMVSADAGRLVGFVHIPDSLAPSGPRAHMNRLMRTSPGCPLTWLQALDGGIEILAACLGPPAAHREDVTRLFARMLAG